MSECSCENKWGYNVQIKYTKSVVLKFRDCTKDEGIEGGLGMQLNLIKLQVNRAWSQLKVHIKMRPNEVGLRL